MSTRVVDRVDDWESQSFTGGYRELGDLADEEFSGVVRASGAELYMTKGVVVGIRRGDIEDFEDATGTAYRAPSPALPLLAVMQDNSDEVRDKFYSEKTAISEVDRTLSDGNFTGYIELAENVLSGDYYLVYHGGESMSVGFVGESRRLIDGDEAFRTADDEVGIYEVRPAEVEPVELPDSSEPEPAAAGSDDGLQAEEESRAEEESQGDQPDEEQQTDRQDGESRAEDRPEAPAATDQDGRTQGVRARQREAEDGEGSHASEGGEAAAGTAPQEETRREADATATKDTPARDHETEHASRGQRARGRQQSRPRSDDQPDADTGRQHREPTEQTAATKPRRDDAEQADPRQERAGQRATEPQPESSQAGQAAGSRPSSSTEGKLDLETRAIPSLDPAKTKMPERRERRGATERTEPAHQQSQQSRQPQQSGTQQSQPRQPTQSAAEPAQQDTTSPTTDADERTEQPVGTVDTERVEALEAELDEREAELDQLEAELDSTREEREGLQNELDAVRAERDDLEVEIERLEEQLRELETELGAATDAERRLTPGEALTGTDVFIRYYSKGDATLEKAHAGSGRREDVNENLRLENHTQFEKHAVSIGGKTYDEFLDGRLEYQFVEWVVRDLLFEIRETGHDKQLRDLYDVLPQLDRAELAGVVDVTYTEDGQETRTQESFDVILRDRMGSPLLVANLNDSREAATESMMERLITSAERVGQSSEEFAGAFLVTSSFFDPGALEMASDATQGGLLSRDKRKSFVNLTRKRGYHLCLVEARNRNFHLAVPEL